MNNPINTLPGCIYICGPITGLPLNNVYAFEAVERIIEASGVKCHNPQKLFDGIDTTNFEHRDYMKVCVSYLAMCDIVVTLDGWEDSVGAKQEVFISRTMGKSIVPLAKLDQFLKSITQPATT